MADAPPSDPSHQPAPPQLAAANAIAGQPRTPADRSSMRRGHDGEMHRARGRCTRRQPALSLAAAGIHNVFGPRYRVLISTAVA
jgi:hypothetical protein